ncbi:hypothetical protein BC008_38995 [Mastigocoleus testarum BC008]|uniref:Uncharacterized protein n=1 Tax=Mastigocoleus testarum BC008 TaxID=371196 RepID=A0A0V7ZFA9_9CYAN|nr:hypothetical protein BC008_38995 [Mastigocoleus testarum BC008]
MFLKNDLTLLSLALLITLGLVGIGVWWLRDNVFLKSLPSDAVILSKNVMTLANSCNLDVLQDFPNFSN